MARVDFDGSDKTGVPALGPGDYGKAADGTWWARVPTPSGERPFPQAMLSHHSVTEHGDGTITVSPSILMELGNGKEWHGYLEKGIWRKI